MPCTGTFAARSSARYHKPMTSSDLATRLEAHIAALTSAGPRHEHNSAGVSAARQHLTSTLRQLGLQVAEQRYGDQPHQVNFIAELPAESTTGFLDLGAHWDTVSTSPGADDNASGVAGLLEIGRELTQQQAPHPVRLCFFGEEEGRNFPGSTAHLRASIDRGDRIQAAMVLEMIGYRDTAAGSQQFPAPQDPGDTPAPDVGDFIALIGDTSAGEWVQALAAAAGSLNQPVPVEPLVAPVGTVRDVGRSDHAVYWAQGLPGVMITDTANFRNPHYHQPTDTLETLDLEFAAQVVRMVSAAIISR